MLATQCWRLLEKSGSLCSRVFREKYYPDGNLLRTKLKPGSSFTWQSVMAGLKTFKRGCIWRRVLIAQHLRCNKLTIQSNNSEVAEAMKYGGFTAISATTILYDCNILASGLYEGYF
jgi:hypothetical protein